MRRGATVFCKRIGIIKRTCGGPGPLPDFHFADGYRDAAETAGIEIGAKKQMIIDDVDNGQRINCHGVYGTVIGKRSTPTRRFVLVKMDNGFTLKLDVDTLTGDIPPRHDA